MFYMRYIITLVLIALTFICKGQFITDYLRGDIHIGENKVGIIIRFEEFSDSKEAKLYIPEQMIYSLKASETKVIGDSISLKFSKLSAVISGKITNDVFTGICRQAGMELPTNLKFVNKEDVSFINRPQTPEPPFPYIEKEYIIENEKGAVQLGGTLTLPDSVNVHKLVILVSGSGAQDRNEEIAGHKIFLVIADYLTRNGIAVFRYDDRGVGKSLGNINESTTADFVEDVNCIIKYFDKHPNIDSKKIGILGHSEGGIVAVMTAAKYPKNVAFIINMAGPGVNTKDLMIKQAHDVYLSQGIHPDTVKILGDMYVDMINAPGNTKNISELRKRLTEIFNYYGPYFNEEQKSKYKINNSGINQAVLQFSSPWLNYFIQIKPSEYLKKVKCPVLALNGDMDIQIDADMNLNAMEEGLRNGKSEYFEIYKLDGLNHLFQVAENGSVEEYFYIEQTIDEQVLKIIYEFISKMK